MSLGGAFHFLERSGDSLLGELEHQSRREFDSLEAFARALIASAVAWREERRLVLRMVGKLLAQDMRSQIGHYQGAVGNYLEWAELAESTEDEKARVGAPPDAPLLRFGDLAKSFRFSVDGEEVYVGSTDPVMEYHEFGTSKMPPRSVIGPALLKNMDTIRDLMGYAVVDAVVNGQRMGYRFRAELGGIAQPGEEI